MHTLVKYIHVTGGDNPKHSCVCIFTSLYCPLVGPKEPPGFLFLQFLSLRKEFLVYIHRWSLKNTEVAPPSVNPRDPLVRRALHAFFF